MKAAETLRHRSAQKLSIEQLEPRQVLSGNPVAACPVTSEPDDAASGVDTPAEVAAAEVPASTGDLAALVSVSDAQAYRNQLLAGVSQIAIVGAPGQIAVFDPPGAAAGEGAFGVIHDGDYRPIVAASVWGSGRIVAFGHNGYTNFNSVGNSLDTGQFYLNSIEWITGIADTSAAIVTPSSGTRDWLVSQGFDNVSVHSDWENYLAGADLLVAELGPNVSAAKQAAVSNYVQSGGGLITGGTGWGYESLGYDLVTLDGNQVLREAGLGWANGFRNGTTNATRRSTELANASQALEFTQQLWSGGSGTTAQQEEAGEALQTVLDILPADHPLAVAISEAFSGRADSISATPFTPVSNSLDKAVLTWESNLLQATPVEEVAAHHTAETIYGTIPDDAPRVSDTVSIDTSSTRWHATGLYAAPGEIVTITVPSSLVGRGFRIRINAHTDNISQRDSWERMPVVHRSFDIDQTTIQVASAFGGSIFIDLGGNAYSPPPNLGDVDINIDGAIRQPYFVLGEHTDQEWIDTFRDYPAPYAVFVSDNLIIVQRSSESATLAEPTALMAWWNEVVALQDELAARLEPRTGPELINVDIQNSAGAAHSGFPIQAYDRYWGNLADWNSLPVDGSWGDFHELGHNHQRGWWTFDGDGEVTVNVFSNYTLENQSPDSSNSWAYSADPLETMQRAIADVAQGGTYSNKSSRWSFWFQLADGFGFETYRNVFASYEADNANNPSALPSSNAEEKDQWLVRWSNEVGYDMTEFMVDTWGLTVSQSAINSVAALPDWMPLATSLGDFQIDLGELQVIDAAASGLGMDGVATFAGITSQPQHGTLTDSGNGTYTYEPNIISGLDSFTVSYQSSAGNTQEFVIEVTVGTGFLPGDVNLDGGLDSNDVALFLQGWRSDTTGLTEAEQYMHGDLNLDGTTNFSDWYLLREAWNAQGGVALSFSALASAVQGDFNNDGNVDQADYSLWKDSFGKTSDPSSGGSFLAADGNLDGTVDLADYTVWRNHLGQSFSPAAEAQVSSEVVAAVTEPADTSTESTTAPIMGSSSDASDERLGRSWFSSTGNPVSRAPNLGRTYVTANSSFPTATTEHSLLDTLRVSTQLSAEDAFAPANFSSDASLRTRNEEITLEAARDLAFDQYPMQRSWGLRAAGARTMRITVA
ncbi:M60 family metallopeptidase [Aeoliella sp. ICT_H6.2]|uniref:M60 family metallopeptidase n=1 Tax=Aeoliella straminimaris TaxID=2954799 RepID=A0A9X2FBQ6_9BACT|nr:M60 family metallopeptidase [Aeoliella straminimaris]MCO6043116.1 M60 family metallopeptidase [Aeoliella straminimaris]